MNVFRGVSALVVSLTVFGGLARVSSADPVVASPAAEPRGQVSGLAPGPAGSVYVAGPQRVFLNRLGGTFLPSEDNDSRQNHSSLLFKHNNGTGGTGLVTTIPPWSIDQATWDATKQCAIEVFAPFAFTVSEDDPGTASHIEVVIGGTPSLIGRGPGTAGMSPMFSDCSIVKNSIVYVFPEVLGNDPTRVCEVIAQEVAHSYGLDHALLCSDPMTYLPSCVPRKEFRYEDVKCGELESAPRGCGTEPTYDCSASQNSAAMLLDRVGAGHVPTLWLVAPAKDAELQAGFTVTTATNVPPFLIELFVDGLPAGEVTPELGATEIDIPTSAAMRSGDHDVRVVAHYSTGTSEVTTRVTVEATYSDLQGGCRAAAGGDLMLAALVALLLAAMRRGRVATRGASDSGVPIR